ncbi:3-hydroxyacyl-[acyl-carrier-protein] dehydratase [Thermosyntropha lipolytica DSM 11003]|uniref:3-hydroxyacyl-[acyl-carrier-protein] dehydratase FabZ n=1 Tax=Thermosyntropha lipolytica DSM 11003 TaxID=1123382 RepID=A0A1M5JD64_9FIRM|nr:3-hydroxyacyl-ACP dehydratase FabZ [Thermosyntropha lipolytica]SHG38451.1 3-hydroxyacyl-[acyl-carrier-protein] dehydratase [Thermosyntropha lipolytica DSM 11003]
MHIEEIMKIIPHRYPFLLVDKIVELHPGEKAVGVKNVTVNEPFFAGHFPGNPVMPGVLMIEAVAQVGAIALLSDERYKGKLAFLAGVDKFRFKQRIVPGDVLFITAELITVKGSIGKAKGSISLNGKPVCGGEFLFALS